MNTFDWCLVGLVAVFALAWAFLWFWANSMKD